MVDTSRRQPVFNVPPLVLLILLALAALHGVRLLLDDGTDAAVLAHLAFVPARFMLAFDAPGVARHLSTLAASDTGPDGPAAVALFFLGSGAPQPWTVVSYAALHGSWTHLGLNGVWLLAFGTPVERRIGAWRFLLLFLCGAAAGAIAHWAVDPFSFQPLVGASASVSACMGAALRFAFHSRPLDAATSPRPSVGLLMRDRRILGFVGVWFLTNLVTGIGAVPLGWSDMPIAWQAHVGGFLFGLVAFRFFDRQAGRPAELLEQPAPPP